MAARQITVTPRHCIQHSRFTKQDGWRLYDLSLSLCGNIAVTGSNKNTHRTSIDVYTSVKNSDSRDKPKIFYSKEFDKYESEGRIYYGRYVSFVSDEILVSCLGNKLEVFQVSKDEVLRSRKVNGSARCLSVREREIFIGFKESNKITVYDVTDLNEIKSIILQGIQDGDFPYDMTVIADRILVCVGHSSEESNRRPLIFDEKSGKMLSELTKPTETRWYTNSVTVCVQLGVVAVVWRDTYKYKKRTRRQIVFYSLFSANNSSFLIFEIKSRVSRIRISDRGDRMITMNYRTGEVKVYDMGEFLSFHQLKEELVSALRKDDCMRLTNYFSLSKDQADIILKRDPPGEVLLLALEEKGVIQPFDVDKLAEAFVELKLDSSCCHLIDFYTRTRTQATLYGRFLATLSAHLTASLPGNLCDYFNIPDAKKRSTTSNQNPGLALLLALDEMGIIKPSDVENLQKPFEELRLVQARAKVEGYQVQVKQERADQLKQITSLSKEEREQIFIECLQRKIKSWYETMTPVPWKRSCRWKSADLFVGSGLILTDSKTQSKLTDIDPHCKLEYQDVMTHERLLSESRLILEGEPGCGKTMLSSQLAYDWAQNKFENIKTLIFLPLKFVEGKKLASAVKKFYVSDKTPVSEEDIEAILNRGDLSTVLILDGLEEYNSPKEEGKPSEVHEIMSKAKYSGCKVVLTSRSDYAHDLPECPMLKLGRFGETERNAYIQKVFPDDLETQQDIKRIIEDTPFILDLCGVPLLFVLAVHNIEGMRKLQKGQLDRVTPFMEGMVDTLCPEVYFTDRSAVLSWTEYTPGGSPVEELAFNGLCKGFQQLSWQKDFMERNIDHVKEWIDSGVLTIEEGIPTVVQEEGTSESQLQENPIPEESVPSTSGRSMYLRKKPIEERNVPSTSGEAMDVRRAPSQEGSSPSISGASLQKEGSGGMAGDDDWAKTTERNVVATLEPETKPESSAHVQQEEKLKQTSSGATAKLVPLRLKFLHKVFQEWFAAKYLSSVIWFKNKNSFSNQLTLIDPIDLHYVLRFTCYLCPPSCHIVLNHLLNNYRGDDGIIPKHIMDCICLCYTEYDGHMGEDIKLVVREICKETISIQSHDSRLLQQSKAALLKFASQSEIPILKVQLLDVVAVAEESLLSFNSGVTLDVLDTLQIIEVSRWDQKLNEEHYSSLIAYIASCTSIKTANLSFPSQPPMLLPKTLEQVASKNLKVNWQIGQLRQTLDPSKGMWTIHLRGHQSPVLETSPVVSGQDSDLQPQVSGETSFLSTLPGTSAASMEVSSKQEVSKRPATELAASTSEVSVVEKKAKYSGRRSPSGSEQDEPEASRQRSPLLEAEAMITNTGGIIEIPKTGVKLYIPPNALEDGMDQCQIRIRIIPPSSLNENDGDFTSNSSATVEILPNNLKLKQSVILTLPHCLELEAGFERFEDPAKIFMSHHENGYPPLWEEIPNLRYHLENRRCSIWLQSFCWVKYVINGVIVKGKKIHIFTAGKVLELGDDVVEIEVGYYPDLPGAGEILENSPNLIVSQCKPFIFLKKGKIPLTLTLEKVVPGSWSPQDNPQEIPFHCIANDEERSCPFVFVNQNKGQSFPVFIFRISQGDRGFRQTMRPTLKGLDV